MENDNKTNPDLKDVLNHYKNRGECEKYKAASFLIDNISIHYSSNYKWIDGQGKTIAFSELDYPDFDIALEAFKSIKDCIKISPKPYIEKDIAVVTPDFLIKNIDFAFD